MNQCNDRDTNYCFNTNDFSDKEDHLGLELYFEFLFA